MAIDQLTDDFVNAYADWLGVTFGEAHMLLKRQPLTELGDAPVHAAGYDESKHPRHPRGVREGGRYRPKGVSADYEPEWVGASNRMAFYLDDRLKEIHAFSGEGEAVVAKKKVMRDLDKALAGDPDWEALATKVNGLEMKTFSDSPGENAAARLISSWASTSSDSDPMALQLQIAAEQEFGLTDASNYVHKAWDETLASGSGVIGLQEAWNKHYVWDEQEMAGARKFLRAQYDATQKLLDDAGINTVALYRGVRNTGFEPGSSRAVVTLNPMSSFTTRYSTAYSFAATAGTYGSPDVRDMNVFAMNVPRERILATPLTGFGCLGEAEAIVLGGTDDAFRWTWQTPKPPRKLTTNPQSWPSFAEKLAMDEAANAPTDHSEFLKAWDKS